MLVPTQTIIKPLIRLRRERLLPRAGEVVVSIGQQVSPVQVVARASQQRGFTVVPAADWLGVQADAVADYLLVEEGAAVQKQKPLLRKSGLFGNKEYLSPVNGILYQVINGRLILQQTPDLIELRAMLHGFVVSLVANRGVVIETTGSLIQCQWGSGKEGFGIIKVVGRDEGDSLRNDHISADVRGTVLVAGSLDRPEVFEMAEQNSVRGIIVGSVPARMVPALRSGRTPVLMTDAFGRNGMAGPVFRLLRQSEGREASLFGQTDASKRPEVVVTLPVELEEPESVAPVNEPLARSQRVRVVRPPHANEFGEVITVQRQRSKNGAGVSLPGAHVKLVSGNELFVPYTNLERIT